MFRGLGVLGFMVYGHVFSGMKAASRVKIIGMCRLDADRDALGL